MLCYSFLHKPEPAQPEEARAEASMSAKHLGATGASEKDHAISDR
jgi:hypothetical protein